MTESGTLEFLRGSHVWQGASGHALAAFGFVHQCLAAPLRSLLEVVPGTKRPSRQQDPRSELGVGQRKPSRFHSVIASFTA
ncbi:MAG: hypothetical protein ACI8UD_001104 [Planctomycetota bacterium]|jgi:hypothetical protein